MLINKDEHEKDDLELVCFVILYEDGSSMNVEVEISKI